MKPLNIKNLIVLALLIGWLVPAGAQTCSPVSSDTTVTTSCSTGISWTGGDLTIGNNTNNVAITDNDLFLYALEAKNGLYNSLTNSSGSSVGDLSGAIGVQNNLGSTITSFFNFGTISGYSAIWNDGKINYVTNYNSLTGSSGIWNIGNISVINNWGSIAVPDAAIFNETTGTIGTINNYSAIDTSASGGVGINNSGTISAINNYGSMTGVGSNGRIGNGGFIGTVNNAGTLTGGFGGWGVTNNGTIVNLINSGSITAGDYGGGVWNQNSGNILNFNNSGTISSSAVGFVNSGNTTLLNNSGSINTTGGAINNSGILGAFINSGSLRSGENNAVVSNSGTGQIGILTNIGSISAVLGGTGISNEFRIQTLNNYGSINIPDGAQYGVYNTGEITNLNNYGSIEVVNFGASIFNEAGAKISTLTNTGTMTGGFHSSALINNGEINILNNSGSISINQGEGIQNYGAIVKLNNSGSINSTTVGIINDGVITALTNTGSITSSGGSVDIANTGTITTLNNAQGGNSSSNSTTALRVSDYPPQNYNIIIFSPAHYGQLVVDSPLDSISTFGIYGNPLLTSRTYAGVLSNNVSVLSLQTSYDNMTPSLISNGDVYDLTFTGVSLMGTQQSIVNTAGALAPVFTLQSSVLANSFSYDCNTFGENNICLSAGGRNTAVSAANGLNNTSALLIAAYRPHPHYRIGAYADQNLSVNNAGATVNLGNNTPLIGIFGAWNERLDGTGTEVKVSAAYGQKNTTINRQSVGLGESGTGSSQLNSQGVQAIAKYGFSITEDAIASPYMGIRYTQNNMSGYSEAATTTTTLPLIYSALNTNATTALIGVGGSYKGVSQTTLFVSAGIESDTNTSNGFYYGSNAGIPGITPVNFNPNPVKTRPTATLGAYYDVQKNQRLGITGVYRQEPYQAVQTTSVMATYTIGL